MNRQGSSFEMVSLTLSIISAMASKKVCKDGSETPIDGAGLSASRRLAAHRSGRASATRRFIKALAARLGPDSANYNQLKEPILGSQSPSTTHTNRWSLPQAARG